LKPLAALLPWGRNQPQADELYGAIVARARLPVFYQGFGIPDTLEGRFVVLSVHLFAVLHRLNSGGADARELAQELADRFTADMETVLRELGVGDLSIPKKVRGLAASNAALLQDFEDAFSKGEAALAAAIAHALPPDATSEAASGQLAPYLVEMVRHLEAQPPQDLCAGTLKLPEPKRSGSTGGEDLHGEGR
jgi:cytochrome b pre-mRNA-processing protein 3